jgi:ABC-type nitrate/sulfonate/bicarbonate transport system substrate-binding protein
MIGTGREKMTSTRRFILAAVAAAAAFASAPAADAQVETKSLQIWTSRDAQQGTLPVVAMRQGFFEKEGVNVEVKFVSSGSEIPAGMAGGTIPIAVASWTNPMAMVANGIPARVLAQTADISATQQMVVRPQSNIATPKDLEGKKVALTRIGLVMSILEKMCKDYGCDVSKITLVNMAPQDIVLAFQRGEVDAIQTWEPWATYATQQGGKILLSATQSFVVGKEGQHRIDGIYAAVFGRTDFVEKNPKTVQAVLRAMKNAADWTQANQEKAAEIIGREIDIPKPIAMATLEKVHNQIVMSAEWAKEFDEKAKYLAEIKELKRATTAKDAFDPAPLKAACSECVKGF